MTALVLTIVLVGTVVGTGLVLERRARRRQRRLSPRTLELPYGWTGRGR